jgi:surface-anchored protein
MGAVVVVLSGDRASPATPKHDFNFMRMFFSNAHPHPGPLPRGEGEAVPAAQTIGRVRGNRRCHLSRENVRSKTGTVDVSRRQRAFLPLLGERAGVRASVAQTLLGLVLCIMFGSPVAALAQVTYLTNQHMDFRLEYDASATGSNRLNVILGYDPGQRATNDQVYIVGHTNAKTAVSSNPNFAFLGAAGTPVWILPQSQDTALPYLGISAEDIPSGVFADPMELELISVEGPGNFFAWAVSGAGQPPNIKFIATNGVVSPQFRTADPFINNHEHNNWAFSTNGLYRVTFRVNGQFLSDTTNTLGRDVAWAFQILPLRPWENWVSTNWLPATAAITNGPAADPDGDGIPNALEYALDLNPNMASTTGLPQFTLVTEAGETYGALTFTRVKAATDIDYLPSVRSDLSSGAWTTLTEVVSVLDHGETEVVTMRDSVPHGASAARFFQFRVRLNYP